MSIVAVLFEEATKRGWLEGSGNAVFARDPVDEFWWIGEPGDQPGVVVIRVAFTGTEPPEDHALECPVYVVPSLADVPNRVFAARIVLAYLAGRDAGAL